MDAEKPTGSQDQKERLYKHLLKRSDGEHREQLPGSGRSGEQSLREPAATQPKYRNRRNQSVDHHEQDQVCRCRILKSERQCSLPAAAGILNPHRERFCPVGEAAQVSIDRRPDDRRTRARLRKINVEIANALPPWRNNHSRIEPATEDRDAHFLLVGIAVNTHVLIGCNCGDELAAGDGPGAIEDADHQRWFAVAAHRNSNDRHNGDRHEKQHAKPALVPSGAGAIGRGCGRNNI